MKAPESTVDARPQVSVVVCTYNRFASLADTLKALAAQRCTDLRWELLVVDNNSHDGTRCMLAAFRQGHPALDCRYLFQPEQGLSHARNLGIAEACGELILFTDDDVIVSENWIQTFVDTMRAFGCDACGGYVAPIWEQPPPSWLSDRFHGFLAIRMDENGPRMLGPRDDPPFGANMGFRRSVFDRLGGFDTALGRKGQALAGGEEWDLFHRLQASGGQIVYDPALRVQHKVEAFRLRKGYFRRWRYDASRGEALRSPTPGRTAFGIPRFLFLQLLRAVLRTLHLHASAPADVAFRQEMIIWHFLGLMTGNRARSKRSPG